MTPVGSLFAGYGGLDMALRAVFPGTELAFVADIAQHDKRGRKIGDAPRILSHRYPDVPNLGDVTRIDWTVEPRVDAILAGFPCQDVSVAGSGAGLRSGTRTGLWTEVVRAIRSLRPGLVVLENVPGLLHAVADSDMEPCPWCVGDDTGAVMRALGAVLADLAGLGFNAEWGVLSASAVGAPHRRDRIFILAAHPDRVDRDAWRRDPAGGTPQGGALAGPGGRDPVPLMPTPRAMDGAASMTSPAARAHVLFPTPRATDGTHGGPGQRGSSGDLGLPAVAALFPTPTTQPSTGNGHARSLAREVIDWDKYLPAVTRWEPIIGRPAPHPVHVTRTGTRRLDPRFVEWMMGLPHGHVTAVPGLSRNQQLHALGNGVVPLQGATAIRELWARLAEPGGAA